MNAAWSVLSLSLAVAAFGNHGATVKDRPVSKVVRLLEDMKAELERERADDEAVYEQLDCWCRKNDQEKSKAIEVGEAKIEDLKSSLGEFAAKIEELRDSLGNTRNKLQDDQKALDASTAIRTQEASAFHGEEKDMLDTIQACKQALVVLGKHHPSLSQLRQVAQDIEGLKMVQLSKDTLGKDKIAVLKAFLQQATDSSTSSLRRIPGFESYTPQSGQIFGILKQIKEEFEGDLGVAQKQELKAREAYAELKLAKEAEMAAGRKKLMQLEQDDADFRERNEQAYEEFLDTQAQLKIDQTFLANLRKRCTESEEEYQARSKGRLEELTAVSDTIAFLNSDEAFEVFDRTVNVGFLQTGKEVHYTSDRKRAAVVSALRRALRQTGNPELALLAEDASIHAFTEVKAMITKIVDELTKQQTKEVQHRDWCIEEMNTNKRELSEQSDKKESLEAEIEDLKKTITALSKEIEGKADAIKEMENEMRQASEVREAEHADFQETVTDQRITQTILQKSIDRMKQVYAVVLAQQAEPVQPGAPHVQLSGTATDAGNGPSRFTKYEKSASGNRVIAMLETVLADSTKLENDALAGEQDAQSAYENFMKDSNGSIAAYQRAIGNMSENRAKAEQASIISQGDHAGTIRQIGNLDVELTGLRSSCDFLVNNFDARQEARATEIEALNEAKAILSGKS